MKGDYKLHEKTTQRFWFKAEKLDKSKLASAKNGKFDFFFGLTWRVLVLVLEFFQTA